MKCVIAKMNPVVMEQAIAHYLDTHKQEPIFTFKSLYSDSEPYPLAELLITLGERIDFIANEYQQNPNHSGLILANRLKNTLKQLIKIHRQETTK